MEILVYTRKNKTSLKVWFLTIQRVSFNPIGPGRFFGTRVPGGVFFHPPLESDFSPKKGAIFGPEIKFGIIRALKWDISHIFSSILTIFAFSSPKMGQNHNF